MAPAVLGMVQGDLDPEPRAAGPVLAILVLNAAALGLASRAREGPLGDWFGG